MENIISIDNISFDYGNKKIFENFSLDIKKGTFTTIVGPNGSGKSTLVRILLGLMKTSGKITINGLEMNHTNIKKIISKIGVVFENPDNQFVAETVMDDIAFSLENMQVKPKEIRKRVKEISAYLGIDDILNKEPHTLSGGQKQLVALASALIIEPDILILDEALTMTDLDTRDKIYNILKDINKNKKITIINVTHEMDEVLYGNDIILLDQGKIVLNGSNEEVLENEKAFNKIGLKIPFMAELSIKLKYYGLVDKMILNLDEMVNKLWK
ncbi:MAG TPA: ATP-binding cassette domain-containing protein [Bacilli bacterium]|nr:ATP-binding cassette domain-containing protein [Bacilli bacterium]